MQPISTKIHLGQLSSSRKEKIWGKCRPKNRVLWGLFTLKGRILDTLSISGRLRNVWMDFRLMKWTLQWVLDSWNFDFLEAFFHLETELWLIFSSICTQSCLSTINRWRRNQLNRISGMKTSVAPHYSRSAKKRFKYASKCLSCLKNRIWIFPSCLIRFRRFWKWTSSFTSLTCHLRQTF